MKEIVYRFICAYGLLQTQGQLSLSPLEHLPLEMSMKKTIYSKSNSHPQIMELFTTEKRSLLPFSFRTASTLATLNPFLHTARYEPSILNSVCLCTPLLPSFHPSISFFHMVWNDLARTKIHVSTVRYNGKVLRPTSSSIPMTEDSRFSNTDERRRTGSESSELETHTLDRMESILKCRMSRAFPLHTDSISTSYKHGC